MLEEAVDNPIPQPPLDDELEDPLNLEDPP